MRNLFIAGLSGSIGRNTLSCLNHLESLAREERADANYSLEGASVDKSWEFLLDAAGRYPLKTVAIANAEARAAFLSSPDAPRHVEVFKSTEEALAASNCDVFVNALSGSSGLGSSLLALEKKISLLLANKESVVMGGHLMRKSLGLSAEDAGSLCFPRKPLSGKNRPALLPLDSEHAALFSLLEAHEIKHVEKLVLTASGGPFFAKRLSKPSIEEALAHPNWKMGAKISIDSATMMNKGLELIEAHFLFNFPYDKIDVLIHPQQAVHSLLKMKDGMLYAELGMTDMRYPIQRALSYPNRLNSAYRHFSLTSMADLSFHAYSKEEYPLFETALQVAKSHQATALIVMNAANEQAIELFLAGAIGFHSIAELVEKTLNEFPFREYMADSVESIQELNDKTQRWLKEKQGPK